MTKLDLYRAVNCETQRVVYDRFEKDVAGATSFVGGIEVVLDTAHELNNTEPSLARFLGAVRIDVRRGLVSDDASVHLAAVKGIKMLLEGTMIVRA